MSWILYFIYLLLLIWAIQKSHFFEAPGIEKKWLITVFLTKIAGGFTLFVIYNYFYSPRSACDIFNYFDDGLIIHNALFQNPMDYLRMITGIGSSEPHLMQYYDTCNFWLKGFNYGLPNDNHIIIRLNAILCLISMGNFHIHNMIFGFLGFVGLWAIYKSFARDLSHKRTLLLLAVFFFPSVWLWTSGATKESFLIFAFGLFIYNYRNMLAKPHLSNILGVFVCIWLLMMSKFYVLMAALPSLAAIFWIKRKPKAALLKFVAMHVCIFCVAWLSKFITQVDLFQVICNKQHDFIMMSQSMTVGSYIQLPELKNGLRDIVANAPASFARTLLRPTIFEGGSLTMIGASLENALIILALLATLFFVRLRNMAQPEVWCCLSFITILFVLIGLTTPVLGALVRYKVPALPFLGILLLLLTDDTRIQPLEKWLSDKLKGRKQAAKNKIR
ncbi:MAG: hypothetical protein J6W13_00935 [Salinivirgaceae bacterium]|nr:hypothetical protein [Salinivirgaceae bacterium]